VATDHKGNMDFTTFWMGKVEEIMIYWKKVSKTYFESLAGTSRVVSHHSTRKVEAQREEKKKKKEKKRKKKKKKSRPLPSYPFRGRNDTAGAQVRWMQEEETPGKEF